MGRKKKVNQYEYQLQVVANILKEHRGRENAILSKKISRIVGFPMEDTQSVCRKAIRIVAERYALPIVACKDGYYVANTRAEVEMYIADLDARIEGIKAKRQLIINNFNF